MRLFASTLTWLIPLLLQPSCSWAMSDAHRLGLRDDTAALFRHGYEGYMKYAYPADELRPLTCGPLKRDPDPTNIGLNDIHANVSITLIDVLSSLPLIHPAAFPRAVELVAEGVSFDQDVKVQVFEMTIRALGALLSTYQYLDEMPDDPVEQAKVLLGAGDGWVWGKKTVNVKRYKGRMLDLALDLGKRLLPAFNTLTGIPYARVNLRRGVEKGESIETCTAGAGSLILEFSLLSRLTGDERFENLAHRAYMALWNRRSQHNLLGNSIGVTHGQWLAPGHSGVGAGMDSFFEYGLKAGIMLNDDVYLDIFRDSYAAIQTHVRTTDGFIYRPVQSRLLQTAAPSTIDSLAAFFAGTQVMAGDIESAIRSHLVYWNLWRKYSAIPESWAWAERKIEWAGWPGRPEFIESTYYLYQATKDPFYLRVGERVLTDLKRRTKTKCGFATLNNVETGDLEDRMESFVLSETLKYLYLLFADTPFSNENKVFTTEGHPLKMSQTLLRSPSPARRSMRKGENQYCPSYEPHRLGGRPGRAEGIVVGIQSRPDYEYARALVWGWDEVGVNTDTRGEMVWRPDGFCAEPLAPKFAFEIILSPANATNMTHIPEEDPSPGPSKVQQDATTGDFVIGDIQGLRLGVRWRFDGKGYDVSNIGPHRIHPGQQVIVSDPAMHGYLPILTRPEQAEQWNSSPPEVLLRFTTYPTTSNDDAQQDGQPLLHVIGATATFGRDFGLATEVDDAEEWVLDGKEMKLVIPSLDQVEGCEPIERTVFGDTEEKVVILLQRGGCTFHDKLINAKRAGAKGVLVIGNLPNTKDKSELNGELEGFEEVGLIRPSTDQPNRVNDELDLGKIGMVYTEYLVGEILRRIVDVEKKTIKVEFLPLENDEFKSSSFTPTSNSNSIIGTSTSTDEESRRRREGKLIVDGWEIWNLRVVEG